MKVRSFIIAYALVLVVILFADRRPSSNTHDRYSHIVDLTDGDTAPPLRSAARESRTHIIAPGALIPGTWAAGQIPAERLVAPLVVMDLNPALANQSISLDDISVWESHNGMIPQGAILAIRRQGSVESLANDSSAQPFPVARDAAQFLIDARSTIGFAVEAPVDFAADRTLARQLALRGAYVVEGAAHMAALPATGSLIIVAPEKNKKPGQAPVRILAMVR